MSTPNNSADAELTSPSEQDWQASPVQAVVTAVADATEQSPLEMQPLSEVVAADALNALFDRPSHQLSSLSITFEYCGQQVTVTADRIQVTQSTTPPE